MKWYFFLLFFVFLPSTLSVGIQSPQDKTIVFSPGVQKTFTYGLINAPKIGTFFSGDLAEYATVIDPAPETGPRTIKVLVQLPQELEPGTYILYVGAQQIAEVKGMVGGLAQVRSPIKIISLYPGKYPTFDLRVPDVNVDDPIKFYVGITNYGTEEIQAAYADIELFDPDNNSIATTRTNGNSVGAYESGTLEGKINSKDYALKPGIYRATAKLTYDGAIHEYIPEVNFNIGALKVVVAGTTEEVIINATNKYQVWVESDWSGVINDVYAVIRTPNEKTLKTPNIDLVKPPQNMAKAQGMLETYWETHGLPLGEYDISIEIYYNDQMVKHDTKVRIAEGEPPIVEKPKGFQLFSIESDEGKSYIIFFNMKMPLMIFLMAVLVIAVLINTFFVLKKTHSNQKKDDGGSDQNKGNIRPPSKQ